MAFQALLFCPDDKTARTVTQVLSELEFDVEPCTEPFAAVKKLMSGHFDALVVDCDNEQNATLLFKSARNSTSNQTSLAVAIVEGQAGVAKAFRIGANLVLTKPINVEQSKGTLRVARGLLRKGEPSKPGMPAATPAASAPSAPVPAAAAKPVAAKPVPPRPVQPAKPAVTAAPKAPSKPAPVATGAVTPVRRPSPAELVQPPDSVAAVQAATSSGLADPEEIAQLKGTEPAPTASPAASAPGKITSPLSVPSAKPPATPASSLSIVSSSIGAASAPAPAREVPAPQPDAASVSAAHPVEEVAKPEESGESALSSSSDSGLAPSFTFGGANAPEESDGGRKKIFMAVAAAILVVVLGYAAYAHFSGGSSQPASQAPTAAVPTSSSAPPTQPAATQPVATKPAASTPAPSTPPAAQPSRQSDLNSQPAPTDNDSADADSAPSDTHPPAKPASNSTSAASKSSAPAKPAQSPLVVKGGAVSQTKAAPAAPDTPAPSVIGMAAPGTNGALSNLVESADSGPKPVLQAVSISQGVSQGLLIKKVHPVYPKTALAMRIEGLVELTATISKTGDITGVKVVKGDPQLTKAASDAVKQWKYKPYLLNGEPVEITTQVTVNFKLPD
jgi:periplasmic protein TonB